MWLSRISRVAGGCLLLALAAAPAAAEVGGPVPVSPGFGGGRPDIADECPTFNWSASSEAAAIELLVYEVAVAESAAEPRPVVRVRLPGGAFGWTPPARQCLERGRVYGWTVRAKGPAGWSEWADPRLFRVAKLPSAVEVEEAVAVLRDYLAALAPRDRPTAEHRASELRTAARNPVAETAGRPKPSADKRGARGPELRAGIYTRQPLENLLVIDGGMATAGAIDAAGGIQTTGDLMLNNAVFNVSGALTTTVALNVGPDLTGLGLGALQLGGISELGGTVGIGSGAGQSLMEGFDNSLVGYMAAADLQYGDGNSILGANALRGCVGSLAGPEQCENNTVIGTDAAWGCTDCSNNVIIGKDAGALLESAQDSIFMGSQAGQAITDTIGSIIIGMNAASSLVQANDSILIGRGIAPNVLSATRSVIIGATAASVITSSHNVLIGAVLPNDVEEVRNNVLIGASIGAGSNVISNTVYVGDDTHQDLVIPAMRNAFQDGPSIQVNPGTAKLGQPLPSSRRFKEAIRDMEGLSAGVLNLRPVVFRYRPGVREGPRPLEFGLIAEEVAEIFPELVYYDSGGQPFSVSYKKLTPMLVNELQRQQRMIEAQRRALAVQQRELRDLQERLQAVDRRR